MNKTINGFALLAIAGLATFSSCSKEVEYFDSQKQAYEESFSNRFGNIAADQDWNMATRGSVDVTVPSTSEVTVYALIDDKYTLVADYEGVSGTQSIEFDMPKGTTKLMVNTPSTSIKTTVGGSVDFSSTRSSLPGTRSGITVSDMPSSSDITLTAEDAKVYQDVLPEKTDNRANVTKNFTLVSSGEIVIYPIYWMTRQTLTLGVYYYDANGNKQEVDVYTMKDTDNDKAKLLIEETGSNSETTSYESYYVSDSDKNTPDWLTPSVKAIKNWNSITQEEKDAIINAIKENYGSDVTVDLSFEIWGGGTCGKVKYSVTKSKPATMIAAKDNSDARKAFSDDYSGEVLSKGIKVEIPKGTVFGMYTRGENTLYSEESLNFDPYYEMKDGYYQKVEGKHACHAAIYKVGDTRYLGFEDWADSYDTDAMDLNDLIVKIDGVSDTEIIDKDVTNSWIIACEDLGSTDDYDFNDVVVKVDYVSGKTTATVTPLAAGGTLASTVYFNNEEWGEIHKLINGTEGIASGSLPMLNTDGGSNPGAGASQTFTVDENFSLASSDGANDFGGFAIKVQQSGENADAKTIKAPKEGSVPQMFLVSSSWKWPKERKQIEKAYPGFSTWVSNAQFDWTSAEKDTDLIYGAE